MRDPLLHAVSYAGYRLFRGQRRIIDTNIRLAYPSRSAKWRADLARAYFHHLTLSSVEILKMYEWPQRAVVNIEFHGEERLLQALAIGKGVILVSGHYGNYELVPFFLQQRGFATAYIGRPPQTGRSPVIDFSRHLYRRYMRARSRSLSLAASIAGGVAAAHHLRDGKSLLILADLPASESRFAVELLGIPHHVSRAPAALALRTGAALLPLFIQRIGGRTRVVVEPEIVDARRDSRESEGELRMMLEFVYRLQQQIVHFPEQWCWAHRHWRG